MERDTIVVPGRFGTPGVFTEFQTVRRQFEMCAAKNLHHNAAR
jgi:hypothetical protein